MEQYNASMEAIATKAGVSKGGLYHHFSGKDEILLHANRKLNEPVVSMMEEALGNSSPMQGLTGYITRYIDYWYGHMHDIEFMYLSMTKAMKNPDLRRFYEDYLEQYIDFFERLFKSGIKKRNSSIMIPARMPYYLLQPLTDSSGTSPSTRRLIAIR